MKMKKLLSMVLCLSLLLVAMAVPVSAAEPNSEIKDLTITATECNVEISFSDDGQFSYDYDKTLYDIITQSSDSGTTINITGKTGTELITYENFVKIQVPNVAYNQVNITAKSSGVNLPAFNSNLSINADTSSISAVIPAGYNKSCSYVAKSSSGGIIFQEGAANYKYSMKVSGSAVALPSSWTKYPNYGAYTYQSGDSTGMIDVDITGCSFFVTVK